MSCGAYIKKATKNIESNTAPRWKLQAIPVASFWKKISLGKNCDMEKTRAPAWSHWRATRGMDSNCKPYYITRKGTVKEERRRTWVEKLERALGEEWVVIHSMFSTPNCRSLFELAYHITTYLDTIFLCWIILNSITSHHMNITLLPTCCAFKHQHICKYHVATMRSKLDSHGHGNSMELGHNSWREKQRRLWRQSHVLWMGVWVSARMRTPT